MNRKALIIAALPTPFEGPWVELDAERKWVFEFEGVAGGEIQVEQNQLSGKTRAIIGIDVKSFSRVSAFALEVI